MEKRKKMRKRWKSRTPKATESFKKQKAKSLRPAPAITPLTSIPAYLLRTKQSQAGQSTSKILPLSLGTALLRKMLRRKEELFIQISRRTIGLLVSASKPVNLRRIMRQS
jgi:hypothetical protein